MVVLNVKRLNESLFLFETKLDEKVYDVLSQIVTLQNGRLKVQRAASHMQDLCQHGVTRPVQARGLLDEQIQELRLSEESEFVPEGGSQNNPDPTLQRTGQQPSEAMKSLLERTAAEAVAKIGKENVQAGVPMEMGRVTEAMDVLRGAVNIVFPMGLPEHDPLRMELENREELAGSQASKEVLDPAQAVLWFASKELMPGQCLKDFLGKNEKTKVVVKLTTRSAGQPPREPVFSEAEQARLMMANHQRREELAALDKAAQDDDSYLNSQWADPNSLKRKMQGVNAINWK